MIWFIVPMKGFRERSMKNLALQNSANLLHEDCAWVAYSDVIDSGLETRTNKLKTVRF